MMDFERAMRDAMQTVVPNAKLESCYFHFCQATKRNLMKHPRLVQLFHTNVLQASIASIATGIRNPRHFRQAKTTSIEFVI